MTAEQAPGIPWHDHEWVEVTRIGDDKRTFECVYDPPNRSLGKQWSVPGSSTRCPAEKQEDLPKPPRQCECCGQVVYE